MRKTTWTSLLLLLFLITTATTCDYYDGEPQEEYPLCSVTGVSVAHWDNSGKLPQIPAQGKAPKEAYLMEILLTTDGIYQDKMSYQLPALQDSIARIRIYTQQALNTEYQAGADITSSCREYPLELKNKINDHTMKGYPLIHLKAASSVYKVLSFLPDAGVHQFRVVLSFTSGRTMEVESEPIEFY